MRITILILIILIYINLNVFAGEKRLILASTTSTYDSGFLTYVNNHFQKKFDISVHVLSLGTGQAIEVAKQGNADILLVHHKPSELKFINDGYGIKRHELMYNDYIIVGPINKEEKCDTINSFFLKIKKNKSLFISRSDDSGTHLKEKEIWNILGYNPDNFDSWHKKIGQGMGATLLMANELKGYTIADRATWISFNKKENLKIICENRPPLKNNYSIIAVNPKINSKTNFLWASKYINWLISEEGKKIINDFKINNEQVFFSINK